MVECPNFSSSLSFGVFEEVLGYLVLILVLVEQIEKIGKVNPTFQWGISCIFSHLKGENTYINMYFRAEHFFRKQLKWPV